MHGKYGFIDYRALIYIIFAVSSILVKESNYIMSTLIITYGQFQKRPRLVPTTPRLRLYIPNGSIPEILD